MSPFKPGDIVRLKTGSRPLIVEAVGVRSPNKPGETGLVRYVFWSPEQATILEGVTNEAVLELIPQ